MRDERELEVGGSAQIYSGVGVVVVVVVSICCCGYMGYTGSLSWVVGLWW
jgi:hypothetical protein